MRQRGLCCRCVSVCRSVCLDVRHTPVSCLNGLTYLKTFRPSDSHIILILSRYQIPRGTPSAGSIDKRWMEKICNFRLKSAFISEMVGGQGCLTVTSHYGTLIGSHRCRIDKCQFGGPLVTFDTDYKVTTFLKSNISETTRDRAIVTIERQ